MEFLDIVNEKDEVIGREERNKAHDKHLLHRASHVIIVNNKNQILLQLRKSTKKQYPLYWSSSVAGHASSGETAKECALKETEEEIGIKTDFEFVGKFIVNDSVEHEMVSVFFGRSVGPFHFLEREIEKAEFFDIERLRKEKDQIKMTPHCKKALELVLDKYFSHQL